MRPSGDKQFFTALESLRGIAALMVVFFHISPWYQPFFDFVYARNGFHMVDFFFVLSGFVMALNYGQRIQTLGQFKQFALLRAVRLYPVHLVFLLLFLGVECLKYLAAQRGLGGAGAIPFQTNSASAFVDQLFLVQALGFTPAAASSFNGPSWSISTEYYTYLIFGLALLLFGSKRLTWVSLLIVLAAGGAYLSVDPIGPFDFGYTLRCLCGFFVGCVVYALYARGGRWPSIVTLLALISIVIFLGFSNFQKPVLVMIPLAAILILSIIKSQEGGGELAELGPLPWVGNYFIFVVHVACLGPLVRESNFTFWASLSGACDGIGSVSGSSFCGSSVDLPSHGGCLFGCGYIDLQTCRGAFFAMDPETEAA